MKKILLILCAFFAFSITTYGSTNTYERTKDDLRVPEKVHYKDSMYNNVMSTPSVNASEKVYDYADLFTDEEELKIYNNAMDFINKTKLDIAIVTINTNPKGTTMVYADDFYDYNDFSLDGLIYIIDMQNREFYISTSGQAILYYDDSRIDYILTSMDYSMMNHNYYQSTEKLFSGLIGYYESGLSDNGERYEIVDGKIVRRTPYLMFTIISFAISGVVILILTLKNKPVKLATNSRLYIKKVTITNTNKTFVTSHTNKVYIPPVDTSSGGSSGHFSSGGGFHSGSSGISHGGGGHRF